MKFHSDDSFRGGTTRELVIASKENVFNQIKFMKSYNFSFQIFNLISKLSDVKTQTTL